MTAGTNIAPGSPAELLGDAHPLLEQIGAPDELAMTSGVAGAAPFARVIDLPSLGRFLEEYRASVLVPVELPAIVTAYQHAVRGELKELIALDQRLTKEPANREFALASCRVGQRQCSKLRPMRDQRVVQRYLAAIEAGEARGWHTLVYGLSLAMFSLPLRQGLQNYVEQTTRAFVDRALHALRLPELACDELLAAHSAETPAVIARALDSSAPLSFR